MHQPLPWFTVPAFMLAFAVTLASAQSTAAQNNLPLMPMPASIQPGSGEFLVDKTFSIVLTGYTDARLERASQRFLQTLSRQTGIPFLPAKGQASFVIKCAAADSKQLTLGEDESYRLQVTPAGVRLEASNPLGAMHGLQTFLQLVRVNPHGFAAPALTIEDRPRFPWRGLLIDVSRHFLPVEVIKRNLDGMEAVKMNVLHWHLSDDQGFRVESRKFPKFQQMSSDGLFYTQEQIRDVIEYARDRGIRVVPEFDMPGHTASWFAAYPELAAGPGPFQVERNWGVFDPILNPADEHVYKFLDGFIGEMAGLFPDAYFHIGGDEVNGKQWDANPKIQEFMRAHGFKNNNDLQAYFNQRILKIVQKHGKIMEGWDEILHPVLPKDIVIQSWRGQDSLADAARKGYRGLLSFGYYLDLAQPASQHYLIDPMSGGAATLSAEEKTRILGGEACMWAEMITPQIVDARIWPRNAAVAERLWSRQDITDVASMYARLEQMSQDLQWRGLTHRSIFEPMLERLTGGADTSALRVLAEAVEPVKEYKRHDLNHYDSTTPLNRLVDAVPSESDAARNVSLAVDQVIASKQWSGATAQSARSWLRAWRDNDQQLAPLLQNSQPLQELGGLSKNVAAVAEIGMEAMDYLNAGGNAPAGWREGRLAFLKQSEQPQAELLNMIVPPVEKLVGGINAK